MLGLGVYLFNFIYVFIFHRDPLLSLTAPISYRPLVCEGNLPNRLRGRARQQQGEYQ